MRDVEIPLRPGVDCDEVARIIDEAIAEVGLSTTLRDGLKKFPGCVHWHAKNGRESGTLEITVWPEAHRAWFTVQEGRTGPWVDAKMKLIEGFIRQRLGGET